jgi:hypothetical protein
MPIPSSQCPDDFSLNFLNTPPPTLYVDSRIDLTGVRFAPSFTYDTVEGEPAPTDDDGELLLVFSPPVLAQVYPQNAFEAPYHPWVVPETGRIRVTQDVRIDPTSNLTSDITLAIKRPGALLAKQKVEIRDGSFPVGGATRLEAELDVTAGDVLYL